jgi:hypothetical protein
LNTGDLRLPARSVTAATGTSVSPVMSKDSARRPGTVTTSGTGGFVTCNSSNSPER